MANRYVRSTDGSDADNGSTWALADATLTGSAAGDSAGDVVYVSDNHSESTASALSFAWAGTATSPTRVLCGDDAAEPPTALATTAIVAATGANSITFITSAVGYVYYYGLTFRAGSGASSSSGFLSGGVCVWEGCGIEIVTTAASQYTNLASGSSAFGRAVNCAFKFAAATQGLAVSSGGNLSIIDGSIASGGTSPTSFLIGAAANGAKVQVSGFDFSNADAAINMSDQAGTNITVKFIDCKLPASWSGSLHSGTPAVGAVFEMFNCDSGDTNYRYRRATQCGTMQEETTIIRTGGASDGTTGLSYKMVSNANAEYPMLTLDSPEIVRWNDTTGSSITATIEFVHDSATALKDDEVWMEVRYLGTSGTPLALFVNDCKADVLAAAADQTDSSETWTTTGMANPNTRKMSVSFTPNERGFIHAVVKLAKASTTVYFCPRVDLT